MIALPTIDQLLELARKRDEVRCPHCDHERDMSDYDNYAGLVSYWGEDGPKPVTCVSCNTVYFIEERIVRRWVVGRTPDEAEDQ